MSFVSGIVGGFFKKSAAKKAERAQVNAANRQIALAEEGNVFAQEVFAPTSQMGEDARNVFSYELLGGEAPVIGARNAFTVGDNEFATLEAAEQFLSDNGGGSVERQSTPGHAYGGYELTPDYVFARDEGLKGIERSAAARGGLNSGATQKALIRFSENVASQGRNDFLNRLAGLSNLGFTADTNAVTAKNNFTNKASTALASIGNAQAAGAIAQGDANAGIVANGIGLIEQAASAATGLPVGLSNGFLNAFGGAGKSSFNLNKAF